MSVLGVVCAVSVAAFAAAVLHRFLKLRRLPVHMRWELYPVAHERDRAHYGGSYLEEPEWWTKPRATSRLGELKVMVPEILLLEGVRHTNRSQWIRTWPFHAGLYLLIAATLLLVVGGLFGATEAGGFLGVVIPILGYAGLVLGLFGALGLLLRRMLDADYREYTTPADYFNLTLFVVTFALALAGHLTVDPGFENVRRFVASLFRGESVALGGLQTTAVVLFAFLVAYVPLTHMSHFFTKWFMYHDIRWGDEPMNDAIAGRVEKALGMKPTWSAPHIRGDGEKTWGEIAAADGSEEAES